MIAGFDASEVRCALPKSPQATVAQRSPTLLLQNQLQPVRWTNISGCIGECRPRLLVFEDSGDVSVSNVQLRDSADWTQVTKPEGVVNTSALVPQARQLCLGPAQLYRRSTGISIVNVTVWGSQQWPNNDGVDFGEPFGVSHALVATDAFLVCARDF
jgi:hypothetical protein